MLGSMQNSITQAIAAKFALLSPLLDERARRLWAAVEARAIGRGGISQVAEATRLSRATIRAGLQELAHCSPGYRGAGTPSGRGTQTTGCV
jgi:DNA-binding phage protein